MFEEEELISCLSAEFENNCDLCSEESMAVADCNDCNSKLCSTHQNTHVTEKMTFEHKITMLHSDLNDKRKCSIHAESVDKYCANCNVVCCLSCAASIIHYGHDIKPLEEIHHVLVEKSNRDLEAIKEQLESTLLIMKDDISFHQKNISKLNQDRLELLEAEFQACTKQLDFEYHQINQFLANEHNNTQILLKQKKSDINGLIIAVQQVLNEFPNIINSHDIYKLASRYKELEETTKLIKLAHQSHSFRKSEAKVLPRSTEIHYLTKYEAILGLKDYEITKYENDFEIRFNMAMYSSSELLWIEPFDMWCSGGNVKQEWLIEKANGHYLVVKPKKCHPIVYSDGETIVRYKIGKNSTFFEIKIPFQYIC